MTIEPEPQPAPEAPNWKEVAKLTWRVGYNIGTHLSQIRHLFEEHNGMPAVFVPGGPYLPAGTQPIQLFNSFATFTNENAASLINETQGLIIVAGIDIVAEGVDASGPWFAKADLEGTPFYHDSQSISEGRGITFAWRGAHLLFPGQYVEALLTTSGSVNADAIGITGWGIVCQLTPYGP